MEEIETTNKYLIEWHGMVENVAEATLEYAEGVVGCKFTKLERLAINEADCPSVKPNSTMKKTPVEEVRVGTLCSSF